MSRTCTNISSPSTRFGIAADSIFEGREGVVGRRIDGEEEIEAERRRCFAVAVRAARGGGRWLFEGLRMGWRKEGVGVGSEKDARELESWRRVGALAILDVVDVVLELNI